MEIKICTANIRFDNPKDIPFDWNGRREAMSSFLNENEFDLIGTQEGLNPQLQDLASLLKNLKLSESHRRWIADRMYPCIFFNPNKFRVNDSGDIWLSETPTIPASKSFGSAFPRLCTWSKFNNHELLFVNLHLDHLQTQTRQEQAKVLVHEISKINDCKHLIMTGDFNEGPLEEVYKIISNGLNLRDPWRELSIIEQATHHNDGVIPPEATRIDWILISKDIKCESIQAYTNSINSVYPSDHFPVFASLKF